MRRDLKGSLVIAALSTTLLVSASTPLLAEGGVDGVGTASQVKAGTVDAGGAPAKVTATPKIGASSKKKTPTAAPLQKRGDGVDN